MMKIVVACDSFKGSLTSREAGMAVAEGIRDVMTEAKVDVMTVADGGEGMVDAIVGDGRGCLTHCVVTGPLGEAVDACYGRVGDMAVMEMAQASGLTLISPGKRNPWVTTSRGTGMMIRDALERGCRRFMIGIGGSATNDGGVGMLKALGFRFIDCNGRDIPEGGGGLSCLAAIDDSGVIAGLEDASFTVACDVSAPLTGPGGASMVFGPQKGADAGMALALDNALHHFAEVSSRHFGRTIAGEPGDGAAGGMGFALRTFLGARLERGIDMVLDAVGFDARVSDAQLVITGEGRLDAQTCMGKVPSGVLCRAMAKGVPAIAIGGGVDTDAVPLLIKTGFRAVYPISDGSLPTEYAMIPEVAVRNIRHTTARILHDMMRQRTESSNSGEGEV